MRLEKIVLDGFKSFADKTEFVFDSSVTAIVGPNGCGKSNVVDAVKWVLGEQSAKSLRSGHMSDVIFSGSSSRKPLGAAEVTLFISNSEGKLAIETPEVQITRRIYQNAESEYLINNKSCRLKDIRELFMDTGIGVQAYSIIEQGQVEQLLSGSKTERRAIFEEAAGISKYKAHKKEALRKLERTEQNLLRLADILSEVSRNLRSVKLQAGKARSYLQHSRRLKELQVNYSLAEYAKNQSREIEKKTELQKLAEQFGAVASEVAKNDVLTGELGRRIIEAEGRLNEAGNRLVSLESKIEQNLQRIEFLRSRTAELAERKTSAEKRVDKVREQNIRFAADMEEYKTEQAKCEQQQIRTSEAAKQVQAALGQIDSECSSLEAELEDEKSGIIDIVRRTAQLHNELQSVSVYRDNLSNQKERLADRAENGRQELEELLTEKAQYQSRLSDIEKVLADLEQSLNAKRKEADEMARRIMEDSRRLGHSKETQSALNGELAVLADMEKKHEGLNSVVKDILAGRSLEQGNFDYVEGIVADVIGADIEHVAAVEAALEGKTDTLIITSRSKLMDDKEAIDRFDARVNFISMDAIEPFVDMKDFSQLDCVKGRASQFVNVDSKYGPLAWKLLGKTIVVDSIDSAVELSPAANGYEFVTLKGELVSSDGLIKLGPLGKATGLISRKSRLRQLEQTIAGVQSEISALEGQLEENGRSNEHLTNLCKELRTAVYEANTEKLQGNSKVASLEQDIQRLSEEQPLIASEIELLESQITQSVQKEYDSKQKLEELEAVNAERKNHIEVLERRLVERKDEQQRQMSSLMDLRIAMGQITEQRKGLSQTIVNLRRQIQQSELATQSSQLEIESCIEQLAKSNSDILGCEAAVSELFVAKEKSQQNSHILHSEIEQLVAEQRQSEQLLRQRRSEQTLIEQKINEVKIELGQIDVRNEDLIERVQEELQIDLVQAYSSYEQGEVDWEAVRAEMAGLRGKIERLGNVNVDAIEEQESLETRHNFLSEQLTDLNSSKGQLQQLINRLNKKSRERFEQTFEQIRLQFQQIFRKLFGGGKADIILEESEDILDSPIEIIAKPPGKETRGISLLSGGEKTMTAIALLFAVFKTKPSPFCFLDEIDAALDEANNERFNLMLQEFRKDSQFIIITHSKRTMSIADVLFGVTMQTRGVTKKISVNFDQFGEQVEEETTAVA